MAGKTIGAFEGVDPLPIKRNDDFYSVGLFLSQCGVKVGGKTLPPAHLMTDNWRRAYSSFYSTLGGGRTLTTFCNSLKNTRDLFDAHLDSGRVGWRESGEGREPRKLPAAAERVFKVWRDQTDDALWAQVMPLWDSEFAEVSDVVLKDLSAERAPENPSYTASTEGGSKVETSTRLERDPKLRTRALKIHGYACQVCGFEFGKAYGKWGEEYAQVHHLIPLGSGDIGERVTDPETDLMVVCANCHCMIHRKQKIVLTLRELRRHMNVSAIQEWSETLTDRLG